MGIGAASGENRATEAAKKAIFSPLLETSITGAKGVLMNITGGSNLSLYEVNEAAEIVSSASDPEVNMIFGAVINENLKDEILVTVIATGFDEAKHFSGKAKKEYTSDGKLNIKPFNTMQQEELDVPTYLRNNKNNNNE